MLRQTKVPAAHGTRSRYNTDGCRCDACIEANAEYKKYRRMNLTHGTRIAYENGCRCERCKAAYSTYRTEHYTPVEPPVNSFDMWRDKREAYWKALVERITCSG